MARLTIGSKIAVAKSVATGKLAYVRGMSSLISSTTSRGNGSIYYKLLSGPSVSASWAGGRMTSKISVDALSVNLSAAVASTLAPVGFIPPTSGPVGDVTVQILNSSLVPKMMVNFSSLAATLYFNAVGSWTIVAPFDPVLWGMISGGDNFVEVDWRGVFKFGGKIEQPGFQDSVPGSSASSGQIGPYITMSGADYLALIANRIAYPDPTAAWTAMNKGNTTYANNMRIETALKSVMNTNIGPGALANRKNSNVTIAPDLGRGNLITYTIKFAPNVNLNMLDMARTVIVAGGGPTGMGLQFTRNGQQLVFDVFVPRDLSGKAWFSKQTGNLTGVQLYLTDPLTTNALVNGSGTLMVEKVAAARTIWNVVETYSDQTSETDINNLNANAQQTLLTGGYGPLLNATVTDTPFLTFGRDYWLGDIVTIEVVPGSYYSDVVTSVALSAIAGQDPVYTVTPTVGHGGDATSTDQSIIGQLISRVRKIETGMRVTQ